MRIHFTLNHGGTPQSKLADVEIHFDEPGLLFGLKLVGCSVWRGRKGEKLAVLVPSRSYATAGGVQYYELLPAGDGFEDEKAANARLRKFKDYIRDEYVKIAGLENLDTGEPGKAVVR